MTDHLEATIKTLLARPELVLLYRGERLATSGGLHFTPEKEWAEKFSDGILLRGNLPIGSKIKILDDSDFEYGLKMGFSSEKLLWDHIFTQGYDAILGHDAMNPKIIDVIVHPKHLHNFKT